LEARGRFSNTIWLAELVENEFELAEEVRAKVKLWSGEVIGSRGADLALGEPGRDLNKKYSDLLKRKKRQNSLKAGFIEIGLDSSWKVDEVMRTYRERRERII
jgi:hypothetical protein